MTELKPSQQPIFTRFTTVEKDIKTIRELFGKPNFHNEISDHLYRETPLFRDSCNKVTDALIEHFSSKPDPEWIIGPGAPVPSPSPTNNDMNHNSTTPFVSRPTLVNGENIASLSSERLVADVGILQRRIEDLKILGESKYAAAQTALMEEAIAAIKAELDSRVA